MKKRTLLTTLVLLAILWPNGKAFMSNQELESLSPHETPNVPSNGRRAESAGNAYLTKFPTTFKTWFQKGKNYLGRKEYEQAILAFRKALKEKPLSPETHFLLGVAYEARGKEGLPGDVTSWDTLAESEYQAAICHGDHLPARFNLGMLLQRLERPQEARHEWEHILTVSPKSTLGNRAQTALDRNIDSDLLPQSLTITTSEEGDE